MKVVVVGAGISGLTAAWTLARHSPDDHEVVVLESSSHVGGRMRSETLGGATLELGAQFLSSHYTVVPRLAREAGLALTPVAPGTAVVRRGLRRFRSDRPMTQLTGGVLPWRAGPGAAAGLARVARLGAGRATSDLAAWADLDGETGRRWARRVLGRHVADGLLEATIHAFYFQSLDQNAATLPAAVAAFGVRPGTTLGIEGGLGRLPTSLAAHLDVRTDTVVTSVARVGDEATVTTESGELRADRVVLGAVELPARVRCGVDEPAPRRARFLPRLESGHACLAEDPSQRRDRGHWFQSHQAHLVVHADRAVVEAGGLQRGAHLHGLSPDLLGQFRGAQHGPPGLRLEHRGCAFFPDPPAELVERLARDVVLGTEGRDGATWRVIWPLRDRETDTGIDGFIDSHRASLAVEVSPPRPPELSPMS